MPIDIVKGTNPLLWSETYLGGDSDRAVDIIDAWMERLADQGSDGRSGCSSGDYEWMVETETSFGIFHVDIFLDVEGKLLVKQWLEATSDGSIELNIPSFFRDLRTCDAVSLNWRFPSGRYDVHQHLPFNFDGEVDGVVVEVPDPLGWATLNNISWKINVRAAVIPRSDVAPLYRDVVVRLAGDKQRRILVEWNGGRNLAEIFNAADLLRVEYARRKWGL